MRNNVNAQKPVLKFPGMLVCSCGARFPRGAWAEHLQTCPEQSLQDRSADPIESAQFQQRCSRL